MSKNKKQTVHLICNAHIDPIWIWHWDEGVSAAISTFRSAAELCEEYDYVFCHGEALLYQAVEEYAPDLFDKIRELVKKGKWHITGGWYLQPDCNIPSGESIIRQIRVGQAYFKEKFGVIPKTVTNFDSFGHSRGLVQIFAKAGQDSYFHIRPYKSEMPLESEQYKWVGFDGSEIKANRQAAYATHLGHAEEEITRHYSGQPQPVISVLWGVGNHGGGPSRKDLTDIANMKIDGVDFIHSTPEDFFANIDPEYKVDHSLRISMPGCYVSVSELKSKHAMVEKHFYEAESMAALCKINGVDIKSDELKEAEKAMLFAEFHDLLPGTSVKAGIDEAVNKLGYAEELISRVRNRAFFRLTEDFVQAGEGEYPIFVYNPLPYRIKTVVECEFTSADQNWDDTTFVSVYKDGKEIDSQEILEDSVFNLDWRKRVAFVAELEPMSISRYDAKLRYEHYETNKWTDTPAPENDLVFTDLNRTVKISKETGNIISFTVDGKEYITGDAFAPYVYKDNADPWAMASWQLEGVGRDPKEIKLTQEPSGVFKNLKGVSIIEDGKLLTSVECLYEEDSIKIRKVYRIYHDTTDVDVSLTVFYNDADSILKIGVPTVKGERYIGQTIYGTEDLFTDGKENVSHRFVANVYKDNKCLAVFNDCTYGNAYKDGVIYLDLLRGAGYCTHPILDRRLVPDRYIERIDQGSHRYNFRLSVCDREELDKKASEFNKKPSALNIFPRGTGKKTYSNVEISNDKISLTAFTEKMDKNGLVVRLFNGNEKSDTCTLRVKDKVIDLSFGAFEIKTVVLDDDGLKEVRDLTV